MAERAHPPPVPQHYDETVATLPRMDGRTVAITGCTSGTGLVMARTCGALGARILMLNRPSSRADAAAAELAGAGVDVLAIPCDLQRFDSVRAAAPLVAEACPDGLDVLANNAGVMGLPDESTVDGCDVQMQTNHLSHFLLTSLVWPLLVTAGTARGEARLVNHSSGARHGAPLKAESLRRTGGSLGGDGFPGFGKWRRYQQSKLANLLFTYALDDRMPGAARSGGVKAVCAHPGPTNSGLQAKTTDAGATALLDRLILRRTLRVAHAVEDGALGLLVAADSPDVASGDFYGPPGRGRPGAPELLPPERDPDAERLLWDESLTTTGVTDFFGA